jgi:hypothetical protein
MAKVIESSCGRNSKPPDVDLSEEFAEATARVTSRHIDALVACGVSREWLFSGAMRFGVSRIDPIGGQFYEPRADGIAAVILPCRPLPAPWEEGFPDCNPGDLVGFAPHGPSWWLVRAGSEPLLNPRAAEEAAHYGEELEIHPSPLDWMRAEGRGIVVLPWAAARRAAA